MFTRRIIIAAGFVVGLSSSCAAEDGADQETDQGEGQPVEGSGGAQVAAPASGGLAPIPDAGMGGEEPDPHPLFFAGEYEAVDETDPCSTSTIWKEEIAIDLQTGDLVIYENVLWQITGPISENWALPDCTPPGVGWCGEQYQWKEVGTCPE